MIKNKKGITLLETVVAMVLFTMIIMTANIFLVGFVKANSSIVNLSQATHIGNKVLEKIRLTPYDTIADDTDTLNTKFQCSWQVSELGNMKHVFLTVAWPLESKDHEIRLSTIISR